MADRSAVAVAFQLAALSVVAIAVTDVYAALWLQLTLPDTWVALVLALALDDASRTYRTLTTPAMLFFGRISMTLYLVHLPVMQYFTFFLRGAQPNGWRGDVWATCVSDDDDDDEQEDCEDAMRRFSRRRLIPLEHRSARRFVRRPRRRPREVLRGAHARAPPREEVS